MKYVVSWTYRWNGSAAENEASIQRALQVFGSWKPAAGVTYHQMVGRLDGTGGFAVVVEIDNPMDLLDAPEKFGMVAEYQIHPVAELAEVAQAFQEGATFRESIG
ncbi:DUF3303 domain-containing protein [Nocardia testacea]|uniref:DUF3303 domain-containing protein n=1 Tax=Nocardia testacea TaxID=248551 RepID=A0ABW7VXK8_9NOCA